MNKMLFMGLFLFSLPLQAQVEVCENDDATGCTTLESDVDDLDDFDDEGKDLGDEISHITIDPYTSVVLYRDKHFDTDSFDEDNIVYPIPSSSSGLTLDADELRSLGLHDEISSIKVHPRNITSCDDGTSIDDCLMEVAKPILIYDEGTPDCNDRFHDGESGFRSAVQTVDDQYKIVFYEIYHKQDCGAPGLVGWAEDILNTIDAANTEEFLGGHEGDGEVAKYAFQKIVEGGETYWALVALRYQHHECTTDKQEEEVIWPLRIYISESKHAQFTSWWECDEWGLNDVSDCRDGTWTEILDDDFWSADWTYEYEDCDYWPEPTYQEVEEVAEYLVWESETCTEDWQTCGDYTGSDGGEILYPSQYSLVEDSFSEDSTDWFDTINVSLDEAGLVVLQPAEEEEPVDDTDGYTIVSDEYNSVIFSDTTLENFLVESSGDMTISSLSSDLTLNNFVLEGGALQVVTLSGSLTLNDFTVENSSYGVFYAGELITATDFVVSSEAEVLLGADRIVLGPSFHVQRGAEFYVFSSL